MKINVLEIPATGLSLDETCTGAELDLVSPGVKFVQPVHIHAEVQKGEGMVEIALAVKSELSCTCGRCLEKFRQPLELCATTMRPLKGESEIDITQLAREEVLLGYPQKWLCRQDCKGLCARCGRNLNKDFCNCSDQVKGTPFAGISLEKHNNKLK